jgi:hypothetical protein
MKATLTFALTTFTITTLSLSAAAQTAAGSAYAEESSGVSAELTKTVDGRNAKRGDEVVAKTTSDTRLADGTRLPKGSRLIGHVTGVQPTSHQNHDGQLAFAFDHAVLHDGRQIPIRATMQSISVLALTASGSDDRMAGDTGDGSLAPGGGMVRGGGPQGLVGSAPGGANGALRRPTNGASAAASGATDSLGHDTSGFTSNAGMSSAIAAPSGPVGNLPGVIFSAVNASGTASGDGVSGSAGPSIATLFRADGKNIILGSGTQMSLAVAPQS